MKRILLTLISAFILSISVCSAAPFPDKTNMDSVDWTYGSTTGTALTFYYAPTLTSVSPQGKLDTWIKTIEKNGNGDITEISVEHTFVNPSFEKYRVSETIVFAPTGKMKSDIDYSFDPSWTNIPDGTPFENTLQAALQYTKDNQ